MQDLRINKLAENLINYSCSLKKGEKVLIEAKGIDYMLVNALVILLSYNSTKGYAPTLYASFTRAFTSI